MTGTVEGVGESGESEADPGATANIEGGCKDEGTMAELLRHALDPCADGQLVALVVKEEEVVVTLLVFV